MIIGIHGKKRSGKDTVAKMLIDKLGFESYALADPIHRSLHQALSRELSLNDVKGFTSYDRDRGRYGFKRAKGILMKAVHFLNHSCKFEDYAAIQKRIARLPYRAYWSIRNLMQCLGTDVVVYVEPDYWLKRVPLNKHIIITDIRQQHELDYFRKNNAKLIFVYRDTNLCDNHVTEKGLDPDVSKDTIIDNNKSLAELEYSVEQFIRQKVK